MGKVVNFSQSFEDEIRINNAKRWTEFSPPLKIMT